MTVPDQQEAVPILHSFIQSQPLPPRHSQSQPLPPRHCQSQAAPVMGVCRDGGQVNHFSEARIQSSGSRTEKETQAHSHQITDIKKCNICIRVPYPHGLGVRRK